MSATIIPFPRARKDRQLTRCQKLRILVALVVLSWLVMVGVPVLVISTFW